VSGLEGSGILEHLPTDLQQLIKKKQGKSSSVICAELFSHLLQNRSVCSICVALQLLDTVPEYVLVQCLELFLSEEDSLFRTEMTQQEIRNANGMQIGPFHIARAECINKVLVVKFDCLSLREELRKLPFHQAGLLLRYLHHLIMNVPLSREKKGPQMLQVMEWMCVVLDAHYHTIVACQDPDLVSILKNISDNTNSMKSSLHEISEIEALAAGIKRRKKSSQSKSNLPYTVTRMKIS